MVSDLQSRKWRRAIGISGELVNQQTSTRSYNHVLPKESCLWYFLVMKQFDQIVYANGKAKHLLLSECEFGLTRQVFIRCNITPLIGNSNTNGNYWM